MFRFEDEPHDDGTCVHEAVESLVGEIVDVAMPSPLKGRGLETVRMMIVQAYPAFFHRSARERQQAQPRREHPLCRYLEWRMHLGSDFHRSAPCRGGAKQSAEAGGPRRACEPRGQPYRLTFLERNRHA